MKKINDKNPELIIFLESACSYLNFLERICDQLLCPDLLFCILDLVFCIIKF